MAQQKSVSFQDMATVYELNEMTDELKLKQVCFAVSQTDS